MKKDKPTIDRRMFKKEGEELQQYLHFRKRGSVVKNKKGKGSYNRQEFKKGWKYPLTNCKKYVIIFIENKKGIDSYENV